MPAIGRECGGNALSSGHIRRVGRRDETGGDIRAAAHTARTIIKSRARTFALIPALLENIEPKLSILTPRQMAARAAKLFREEIAAPRWSGFSGDGPRP